MPPDGCITQQFASRSMQNAATGVEIDGERGSLPSNRYRTRQCASRNDAERSNLFHHQCIELLVITSHPIGWVHMMISKDNNTDPSYRVGGNYEHLSKQNAATCFKINAERSELTENRCRTQPIGRKSMQNPTN